MPPRTRNCTRREVFDESIALHEGRRQRGQGRVRGGRGIRAGATKVSIT